MTVSFWTGAHQGETLGTKHRCSFSTKELHELTFIFFYHDCMTVILMSFLSMNVPSTFLLWDGQMLTANARSCV